MHRALYLLLAVLFLLSVLPSAVLAAFSDTESHWAESAVEKWSENGVLLGYPDGSFGPDDSITRGEFCAMVNRAFGYTSAAGYFSGVGGGSAAPQLGVSREQAFTILGRILDIPQSEAPAPFTDMGDVSSWAAGYINALAAMGIISGAGGELEPGRNITRAEAAQLFENSIKARYSEPGAYSGDVDGLVVITSTGVTLKDAAISGDVIVAESVGEGDADLENVTVSGSLIVRGGGPNSITLRGNTKISQGTITQKKHSRVAVRTAEDASSGTVEVDSGIVILSGDYGNVTVS